MKSKVAAFALLVALLGTSPVNAETSPYDECIQTMLDMKTVLRVMQSCSDAVYLRGDVGEADAICAGARALDDKLFPALQRQIGYAKDPASENRACARESVLPLVGLWKKSAEWQLQYLSVRKDRKANKAPEPLNIIRFVEPE